MKHYMTHTTYRKVHVAGTALAAAGLLIIGATFVTHSLGDGIVGIVLTTLGFATRMYATASLCDIYRDDPFEGYQA